MKKVVGLAALIAAASCAVPTVAGADIMDELNASDAVERKLDSRYPSYTHIVSCRQLSARSFTCKHTGYDNAGHFSNGRASARKQGNGFRVTIRTRRVM